MGGGPVYLDDNGEEYLDDNGETIGGGKTLPFPGMPQGLRSKASPDYSTFSEPESSFEDAAPGEEVPELQPPPMLRRPEASGGASAAVRGPDTGNPEEAFWGGALASDPRTSAGSQLTGEDAQRGAMTAAAGGVLAFPAAALGLARGGGAVQGGYLGYRKGGVPGAVVGAGIGAAAPGVATAADVVDTFGTEGGAVAGGLALAVKKYGLEAVAKFLHIPVPLAQALATAAGLGGEAKAATTAATAAKNIPAEVAAAKTTADVAAAVPMAAKGGAQDMAAVTKNIIEWRTKQKFSGPQIVASLKDVYGIPTKQGNEIARMVLSGLQ